MVINGVCVVEPPVPVNNPPHEPSYQYHFAPEPTVPPIPIKVVADPSQIIDEDADIDVASLERV